jgi:transposase
MSTANQTIRERALAACLSGMKQESVAALYGVNRSTLWRWRQQVLQGRGLDPGRSPGGPRKISREQEGSLEAQLRAHPDATLDEHLALWTQGQGPSVSRATMARSISRLGWSRKKRV